MYISRIRLTNRPVQTTATQDEPGREGSALECRSHPTCIGHTGFMDVQGGEPFSFAAVKPYVVAESLDDLHGPDHGEITLSHALAWSGRRSFDLDDDYDHVAVYKIVLEEGLEEDLRRLINGGLLRRYWREIRASRQVRTMWEQRFPELRRAA